MFLYFVKLLSWETRLIPKLPKDLRSLENKWIKFWDLLIKENKKAQNYYLEVKDMETRDSLFSRQSSVMSLII